MNETNLSQMDMNLLRVFHRIYVERSVSTAAEQLGLTQSAVSHGLRKLRELFNDGLFVRSRQGMIPTPRADAIFQPVQHIMSTLEREIVAAAGFDAALAKRHFLLSMGDMGEVVFLPPLLRRIQASAPGCTLATRRIPNENIAEALESGAVELAIGIFPQVPGHNYQQTIFLHDYVVLAWNRHPRVKSRMTWAAYAREEHIVVSSGSDHNLQKNTLEPLGIRRKARLTVDGFLSLPWLLEGTELLATVPTRLSEGIAQAASVKQFSLPQSAKPYGLQSMWHPRLHNEPAHRWLRETVFDLMNGYPDLP